MSETETALTLGLEGKPYFNFINSLKSPATKEHYRNALIRFLQYYKLDFDSLVKTDPKDIEALLIDHIVFLKQNKRSLSAINLITSAVTHFCVMNDISILTKKINKFKGERESKNANDRAYETEDIQTLVNACPLRMKMIFLVMASTGLRVGALPLLKIGHEESEGSLSIHNLC